MQIARASLAGGARTAGEAQSWGPVAHRGASTLAADGAIARSELEQASHRLDYGPAVEALLDRSMLDRSR
ncbi:MAG TPA: hypothetical protein VKV27_03160 [Solirubrobacteraceae bacterium]|nr:hypothetical protein [Solirubrobacteraceae bacterium]